MAPSSPAVIDAVSHPTRRRILRALVSDSAGSVSAGELADLLEQPPAQVGYHLKTLARCRLLRLSQDGDRHAEGEPHYGWSLSVEPDWLRVVLDVWAASAP